ncbi:MAG: hypothetical protein JOZ78_05590 [Chroococcidiopsidaceae cyanobacterium CP_BM_ER_R8_30]|nr:hypothetical protein [Chroococcidiopsidaceae cyanobacterium CP_BM_ER_R8_30]
MNTLTKFSMRTVKVAFIVVAVVTGITNKAQAISFSGSASSALNISLLSPNINLLPINNLSVALSSDSLPNLTTLSSSGAENSPTGQSNSLPGSLGANSQGNSSAPFDPTVPISSSAISQAVISAQTSQGNPRPTVVPPTDPVPEPSETLGLLTFGAFIGGSVLKFRLKQQKSAIWDKSLT